MSNIAPEVLVEMHCRRIRKEMAAIRLQEEALKGRPPLSRELAALGDWMVRTGEYLRRQHAAQGVGPAELVNRAG
jgi:hypothetical protein